MLTSWQLKERRPMVKHSLPTDQGMILLQWLAACLHPGNGAARVGENGASRVCGVPYSRSWKILMNNCMMNDHCIFNYILCRVGMPGALTPLYRFPSSPPSTDSQAQDVYVGNNKPLIGRRNPRWTGSLPLGQRKGFLRSLHVMHLAKNVHALHRNGHMTRWVCAHVCERAADGALIGWYGWGILLGEEF